MVVCGGDGGGEAQCAAAHALLDVVRAAVAAAGLLSDRYEAVLRAMRLPALRAHLEAAACAVADLARLPEPTIAAACAEAQPSFESGVTPVFVAVAVDDAETVARLLRACGPGVASSTTTLSVVPLVHWAVLAGSTAMVELLEAHGASVHAERRGGLTCVHAAACAGDARMLAYLCEQRGLAARATSTSGWNAAHAAAQFGVPHVLRWLVARRHMAVDVVLESSDEKGMRCAHFAALGGHVDVLRELLALGHDGQCEALARATLHKPSAGGKLPVHLAAEAGNALVLEFLVTECGADPCATFLAGSTPLTMAAGCSGPGAAACVRFLLPYVRHSANSERLALGTLPTSPGGGAAGNGGASDGGMTFAVLSTRPADDAATIPLARSPHSSAQSQSQSQSLSPSPSAALLRKRSFASEHPPASRSLIAALRHSLETGVEESCVALIECDAMPLDTSLDHELTEAVHLIAKHGWVRALRALLARDPLAAELPSGSGALTPLHTACAHGCVGVVRELLARGASASARTADGVTPVLSAAAGPPDVSADIVALLRAQQGVDVLDESAPHTLVDVALCSGARGLALEAVAIGGTVSRRLRTLRDGDTFVLHTQLVQLGCVRAAGARDADDEVLRGGCGDARIRAGRNPLGLAGRLAQWLPRAQQGPVEDEAEAADSGSRTSSSNSSSSSRSSRANSATVDDDAGRVPLPASAVQRRAAMVRDLWSRDGSIASAGSGAGPYSTEVAVVLPTPVRIVDEGWSRERHQYFFDEFREVARTLLLCCMAADPAAAGELAVQLRAVPLDVLECVVAALGDTVLGVRERRRRRALAGASAQRPPRCSDDSCVVCRGWTAFARSHQRERCAGASGDV